MLHHQLEDDSIQLSNNSLIQEYITHSTTCLEITAEELTKFTTADDTCITTHLTNNWVNSSIVILAISSDTPLHELLTKLKSNSIDCTSIYKVSSNSNEYLTYLFVWKLEKLVEDITQRERIIKLIERLLGNIARVYKPSQVLPGTINLVYSNSNYSLSLNRLEIVTFSLLTARTPSNNLSRELKKLRKELGLQDVMKNGTDYNNSNSGFQISSSLSKPKPSLTKVKFEELKSKVEIFNDLGSGRLLTYEQYVGLVNNLVHINGGVALYIAYFKIMRYT